MSADLDLGMYPLCGDLKEGVPLRDGLGGGCGPLKGPRLCQGLDPSRDLGSFQGPPPQLFPSPHLCHLRGGHQVQRTFIWLKRHKEHSII